MRELIEEHAELAENIDELITFLESHELAGYDRMLLEFQLGHMKKYAAVLDRRVARL